jgi:catechol 2,3-dioxygenase-like lactoylglutathione lyase family enzyme
MFKDVKAFSGFSVDDLVKAKEFYSGKLGLVVKENTMGLLELHIAGSSPIIIYPKKNHVPAKFTILNFPVNDINKAVEDLKAQGIKIENYDDMMGMKADEKGIYRGDGIHGPSIAWFLDAAGNGLAVIEIR